MRLFKAILAVLLALAWVPLTAHCQIESIAELELLNCQSAGETPAPGCSHCDDSSCCAWESAQYHLPQNQTPTLVLILELVLPVVSSALDDNVPARAGVSLLTAAPPEIPKTWQFSFRAALPVRAPAFAS